MSTSVFPAGGLKVLLSSEQIQQRVHAIGAQINGDYRGRPLHLVCILKGASIFLADLLRTLELEVSLDFIAVASYHKGSSSSGEVQITKDLDLPLQGRDVLIVEDVVDTGLTLNYLYHLLESRGPRSLKIVTLLDKPSRRRLSIRADYVGFEIPDSFVVGYGLDYGERYRQLPHICVLENSA